MTRHFVIISMPRSGSRMLSSALSYVREDFNQSLCWNEILRPDILEKKQQKGHPPNSVFDDCNKNDECDIIDKFLSISANKIMCCGFVCHFWNGLEETSRKYELTDNLNPWPWLIQKQDEIDFYLLYRENLFRRYISHVLANGGYKADKEPTWHLFGEKDNRNIKVYIDRDKAISNINQAKKKIEAIKTLFNPEEIIYEKIEQEWKNIVRLTSGDFNYTPKNIKPITSKIIEDYSSVVENWEEVKDLDKCH